VDGTKLSPVFQLHSAALIDCYSEEFQSIHVINRAQLIDDVLYFAWTGEQDYETALQVTDYLQRERDLLPWTSAFNNLKLLNRILRQTPNFGFFKVGVISYFKNPTLIKSQNF